MGLWRRVNHPNIVPFLGITYGFGSERNASLVSLWMPNGTLHTFLENYDLYLTDAHRLQLVCYGCVHRVQRVLAYVCSSLAT